MPTTTDGSAAADPGMDPSLSESSEDSLDSTPLAEGDRVVLTSVELDEYAAIIDRAIDLLFMFGERRFSFAMDRELCMGELSI